MVITQRRPVNGDQSVMISQNGAQMEPKLSPAVLIWSTNGAQWGSSGAQVEPTGAHMYTLYMERDPPKWLEFSWEGFEFSWKGCLNIHENRLEFHANLKKNGG